ncbi:MAG: zinc-binding dehydrogenase [Actinobacteria bacterium]|nr:zinc-binding dehydrogenase [Actinomycetota bacterium]
MKAIVKEKKGIDNITYKEVPTPEINDDEVLIKVKAAGVCSTDLHIFYDEFPYWPPVILGHEFSGIIEKTGKNVSKFKNGDRVTSEPQQKVCGVCRYCRLGLIHLCSSKRSPGWGIDGAMAEYIKLPDKLLHKLPEDISFLEGALIETASTVTHAIIERGNIMPTDYVVVIGPGPIGLISAQIAKGSGAQTVVVSGLNKDMKYRLSVARKLCIDKVINAEKEDLNYFIRENTGGFGADMVIECSGSESGINQAIDILAKNGKLIGVGLSGKKSLNLEWDKAILHELNIIPSMSSTYSSWKYTFDMLKTKKLNLSKIRGLNFFFRLSLLQSISRFFANVKIQRGF